MEAHGERVKPRSTERPGMRGSSVTWQEKGMVGGAGDACRGEKEGGPGGRGGGGAAGGVWDSPSGGSVGIEGEAPVLWNLHVWV